MMFFYRFHAENNQKKFRKFFRLFGRKSSKNKRVYLKMAENYSEMEISAEEFYEVINNSDKLIAVNFFAEWHMPCLMFFPVIEDLAEKMKDVRFVKMNIDDNQEVVEKHNVSTIPCLIIFRNGKEIAKIIGAQSIEIIEEKIKGCLITEN